MPVVLQCPACGSRYEVHDKLAGKQVNCQCGAVIDVPLPEGAKVVPPRKEQVDQEPGEPAGPSAPPSEAPSEPQSQPPEEIALVPWLAAEFGRIREQIRNRDMPLQTRVAFLCILYGSIMALLLVAGVPALGSFPLMCMERLFNPVLAAAVVVAGVLLLRGHPQGTAAAGISCALLCFLPICGDVFRVFMLLVEVRPGAILLLLLRAAVVYPIPVCVIVWSLREETAKQGESDEIP